jgi:conjugal transfer ATP-binding protein TraC
MGARAAAWAAKLAEIALPYLRVGRRGPTAPGLAAGATTLPDLLGPESLSVLPDRLDLGGRLARTLVVVGYPRFVEPGWLAPLYAFAGDLRIASHIEPVATTQAMAELGRHVQDLRASLIRSERAAADRDPYTEAALEDAEGLRAGLARSETRLFRIHLLVTIFADTVQQLDRLTRSLQADLAGRLVISRVARLEQLEAFVSTLPLADLRLPAGRNLDAFAASTLMPFLSSELVHPEGEIWGVNRLNNSIVLLDRFAYVNAHTVTIAASGAGKSYWLKSLLTQARFRDIAAIVLDPSDREYERWCTAFGGQYVRLGPASDDRINPLDLTPADLMADPRAITAKVDFVRGLCEVMLGGLNARERAVVDEAIYACYLRRGYADADRGPLPAGGDRVPPTLADLSAELRASAVGRTIADRLWPFTDGSLRLFAGPTTVDVMADLVVFDVHEVVAYERALAPAAYFVLAEMILRRLRQRRGRTFVAIDEAHYLLRHPTTARFVETLFRTGRKLGVGVSLITQSLGDVLGGGDRDAERSARACLANAAVTFLMRQQNTREADELAAVYRLSRAEADLLRSARRGEGIVIAGDQHIALRVEVPPELHALITTDPTEADVSAAGAVGVARADGQYR